MLDQVEQDGQGLFVRDLVGHVDRRAFEIGGDAALADALRDGIALGLEFAPGEPVEQRRAHGIAEGDPDVGISLLQRARHAGQRAAAADRAGEAVDLAVCLVPDFWPRGAIMAVPVGRVVELVRPDRAVRLGRGKFRRQRAGVADIVVGIGIGRRRDEPKVGAAQAQHVLLLLALRLRHHDDRAVAARIGDQSDADPGIAGRALDDDAAGPEFSALLGVLDDGERGAILHRAARIEEFGLAVNAAARGLGRGAEPDQRRVADAIDETRPDVHDLLAVLDPAFAPGGTVDREQAAPQPARTGWRHDWPRIRMIL